MSSSSASSFNVASLFTPEYSTELLQRIQDVYKQDIMPAYPQLRLQKLIDLLEHAEYLFELYVSFIRDNATSDALTSFIIGAFYVYLVMPQSIQFQTRNKSHNIYNEIKTLYENQMNMTNVLLMVKDEVEIIVENSLQTSIGLKNSRVQRKRAYSVPSTHHQHQHISPLHHHNVSPFHPDNEVESVSEKVNKLTVNSTTDNNIQVSKHSKIITNFKLKQKDNEKEHEDTANKTRREYIHGGNWDNDVPSGSDDNDDDDDDEQGSHLWTAPSLEPNDQLKVASELDFYPQLLNEDEQFVDASPDFLSNNKNNINNTLPPSHSPPPLPTKELYRANTVSNAMPSTTSTTSIGGRNHSIAIPAPLKENEVSQVFDNNKHANNNNEDSLNIRSFQDTMADRGLTHRKNSYHSIYMLESEESILNNNTYYDESNGFIQSLDRLQKQSIITAPELYSILSNNEESSRLLLIDLRTNSRFAYSHIIAPNLVHIDPRLLWNPKTKSPIYDITHLENSLHNDLFTNRHLFDYIVYYSDMKTFMKMEFDYHFTLFYLLNTSKNKFLKCVPTSLLGGYEKWKKVMNTYSRQYDINISDYLYRSSSGDSDKKHNNNISDKRPDPPSVSAPWRPHEVPARIRKRPPPPPPSSIPISPEIVPKLPPRIKLSDSLPSREYPFMLQQMEKLPTPSPSPSPINENLIQHTSYQMRKRPERFLAPSPPPPPSSSNNKNYNMTRLFPAPSSSSQMTTSLPSSSHQQREVYQNKLITLNYAPTTKNIQSSIPNHIERTYSIPTIEKNPNIYTSLSITGLRNLGNTCYINSMIQCLFATKSFRDLFMSTRYKKFLKPSPKPNSPYISNSFSVLFRKMYLNGGCSVVPISFLKTCNVLRPDLKIPDDQQDTTEFLMLILDRLHDELSNQDEVASEYPDLVLYDEKKLDVQGNSYKKWFDKNVIGGGLSPVDDTFQGQIENCLQCQRCGHSSYNYSTFYVLSLAIPKPASTTFTRSKRVKLEDCLNMFTSDEVLSGENAWECPHCCKISKDYDNVVERKKITKQRLKEQRQSRRSKLFGFSKSHHHHDVDQDNLKIEQKITRSLSPFRVLGGSSSSNNSKNQYKVMESREEEDLKDEMKQWKSKKLVTVKTLDFISMPKVLIIHLSRFYYDLTKKNETIVTYPLILNIVLKNGEVAKYKLYAIVNHSGNLISGHYTSLVNKAIDHSLNTDEQKWYYFDDEVVKEEKNHGDMKKGVTKISSSNVYVLFYERVIDIR